MEVSEEQKRRMADNLRRSFELLNTVMKLRLAYLKKQHPDKTEAELEAQIYRETLEAKRKQWNSDKT